MSVHITITDNSTGGVVLDSKEARAFIGGIVDATGVQKFSWTDCSLIDVVEALFAIACSSKDLCDREPCLAPIVGALMDRCGTGVWEDYKKEDEKEMTQNQERGFHGVWFPASIWLDPQLSANDKCVWGAINHLANGNNQCHATTAEIAFFCRCSERTVKYVIARLTDLGYLEIRKLAGRKREILCRETPLTKGENNGAG